MNGFSDNPVANSCSGHPVSANSQNRTQRPADHHLNLTGPKKLAYVNGQINQMTKDQIIQELQHLRLNSQGNKDKLKKRLKNHFKRQKAFQLARQPRNSVEHDRNYDYFCVLDFECTCEDGIYDYAHEIIEFPVILVKTKTLEVVDQFHSYCRPALHPIVAEFCTKLTGITQEQVDSARPFLDVLDDFQSWLGLHKLGTEHRYAIIADGPWDMGKFFQMQCLISGLPSVPHQYRYWINIRRSFANLYNPNPKAKKSAGNPHDWKNLEGMLSAFQMEFQGRAHSGLDDAKNIARIVIQMLRGKGPSKDNVVTVSKQEFIMDMYEECMTCSEPDSDNDIY